MTDNVKKKSTAKATKPRGLGRGLSTLLGDAGVAAATAAPNTNAATAGGAPTPSTLSGLADIPVEWINSGPWQPRRRFDNDALADLAASVKQQGIVQPILVRPHPKTKQRYELIAGERRWRAAQLAKLHMVPAIVRELSDSDAYEIALIENIQRADLSAVEEAEGYQQLIETYQYTQAQLSELIGKSRSHIANLLRLLSLPPAVCDLVVEGSLTMGQARPLIGHDQAERLARDVVKRGLSARQVEALVKKSGDSAPKKRAVAAKSADIKAIEQRAAVEQGLQLDINWDEAREQGSLTFKCSDLDQMNALLAKLNLA